MQENRKKIILFVNSISNLKKKTTIISDILGIHAREWISPATATYILQQLIAQSYQIDSLLNLYDIFILPVSNPDG